MNAWLLTLPVTGLITGALFAKILFSRMLRPALRLAMESLDDLLNGIGSLVTDSRQAQRILPLAETHIDHFLRHKLTTAMPMVAMFIGDKTIAQFKGIFMDELGQLLPVFIKAYLEQTLKRENIEPLLNDALGKHLKRLSARAVLAGALMGLAIGLVQLLILYLFC